MKLSIHMYIVGLCLVIIFNFISSILTSSPLHSRRNSNCEATTTVIHQQRTLIKSFPSISIDFFEFMLSNRIDCILNYIKINRQTQLIQIFICIWIYFNYLQILLASLSASVIRQTYFTLNYLLSLLLRYPTKVTYDLK